jgi:hypothetical protein
MTRHSSTILVALATAGLIGCTAPHAVRSRDAARLIEPEGPGRIHTGTLVARVDGQPRDIEYYVNGKRIEPDKALAWWRDSRLELELAPGRYSLEATYRIRGFAGDDARGRIRTRGPIEVAAGGRVELAASLRKDWRGVPDERITYFRVLSSGTPAGTDVAAAAPAGEPAPSPHSSARVPVEIVPPPADVVLREAGGARPLPEPVVIRDEPAPAQVVRITSAGPTPHRGPDAIVIHGDQVLSSGWRRDSTGPNLVLPAPAEPAAETSDVDLPPAAEPTNEDLPPGPDEPASPRGSVVLEDASPPTPEDGAARIAVVLRSDPPGAHVSLDERYVGRTPLRLRLDPRRDHVLQFERAGCEERVQLLSSQSWEQGRSPILQVQLDCP